MKTQPFLFFLILLCSCNSATTQADNSATTSIRQKDSTTPPKTKNEKTDTTQLLEHHLQDTTVIKGDFVLFLRPDSIRFENYAKEDENIYDADSDFGFGLSATVDSIARNKKYKGIHTSVSEKRFIVITDCKNCPQTIDRDTINYGLILASKGREIRIQTNLHSGDYLQDVDEYFNISRKQAADRRR